MVPLPVPFGWHHCITCISCTYLQAHLHQPCCQAVLTWWCECWVKLCGYAGDAHIEWVFQAVPVIHDQVVAVQVRRQAGGINAQVHVQEGRALQAHDTHTCDNTSQQQAMRSSQELSAVRRCLHHV